MCGRFYFGVLRRINKVAQKWFMVIRGTQRCVLGVWAVLLGLYSVESKDQVAQTYFVPVPEVRSGVCDDSTGKYVWPSSNY